MSSDELKRKTVCLKLAKNGIYLCKNPSNAKFVPSRDVSFGLKKLKDYSQHSKAEVRNTEPPTRKPEKADKEPEEETVLQKFIRGFDCGEFCDDSLSSGYSSSVGECSSGAFNSSDSLGGMSQDRKQVHLTSESTASGLRPRCRVEFITPVKLGDNASKENDKPLKPLVVDLSKKKILLKDNPIKIVKSTPNELRQLNRNFITPKVKVENFSHCSDSSSLPLIISPAETPNFSGSSSSLSPYPSTKIEIDYTGSSIQDHRYTDPGLSCPIKSEQVEYGQSPKSIFSHQDNEFILPDNDGFDDAYRNFNNMIQHSSYWNNVGQTQPYNVAPQHSSNVNQQETSNTHQQQSYCVNLHQPYNIAQHQSSNINHRQSFEMSQHQSYSNIAQQHFHKNANQYQSSGNTNHPHQSFGSTNHPHQSLVAEGESEADIMKAAKALYSKRTRTLFHWINPNMPKARLKDSVSYAWDLLPTWQKQIYVNQVIGKCGNDTVTPMINPQIVDLNSMAEVVMSSMNRVEEEAPRKKRKYTRKCTSAASSSRAAASSSVASISPSCSLYNFLSSL